MHVADLEQADLALVDGREGLTGEDRTIADLLRRSGRPVLLAVNKSEGLAPERVSAEFHELALGGQDAAHHVVVRRRHQDGHARCAGETGEGYPEEWDLDALLVGLAEGGSVSVYDLTAFLALQLLERARFAAAHPTVPTAVVPALAGDVHDLIGLRRVGELLAEG